MNLQCVVVMQHQATHCLSRTVRTLLQVTRYTALLRWIASDFKLCAAHVFFRASRSAGSFLQHLPIEISEHLQLKLCIASPAV